LCDEFVFHLKVVAVEASRVDVVTAAPAARGEVNIWVRQNRDLLPYPSEGRWHHDLMEKCCDFGGDCAMAWFCAVFPGELFVSTHEVNFNQ